MHESLISKDCGEGYIIIGLYEILRERGFHSPDDPAVIFDDSSFSYRELNELINCVAYGLHQNGIKKGTQVGILLFNGIDFIATFYALIKLGACISPFNYRYNVDEIAHLQNIVQCEYIVAETDLACLCCNKPLYTNSIKIIPTTGNADASIEAFYKNGHGTWAHTEEYEPDDIVFNIFTGGTTGLPKASQHSQASLISRIIGFLMDQDAMNHEDVFLSYSPMFHTGGLTAMIRAFSVGATFCLLSKFEPERIIEAITKYRVTQISLIPPNILQRIDEAKTRAQVDLSSIRLIRLAGGAANEATVELAFNLMPDAKCVNTYGHSENALYFLNKFSREEFYANRNIVRSIGKPQMFHYVKITDQCGVEVPNGVAGEARGKSPSMMAGYKNVASGFDENGWFPTGDIMSCDENGNYYFHSRCKDMIKSGGENIYAIEVEDALLKGNTEAIAECAVIALPDKQWGEIVAAAVVLRPGVTMTETQVIEKCKKYISSYKKPKKVFFLDALPRTGVGKIQKEKLKNILEQMYTES